MGLLDLFSGTDNNVTGGLLGNGSGNAASLYGDALTPDQQNALRVRGVQGGLLALANLGEGEDKAALNAIRAQYVGLQGKQLAATLGARRDMAGTVDRLMPWITGGGLLGQPSSNAAQIAGVSPQPTTAPNVSARGTRIG
jgi:hypothetical protein